MKKQLLFLSMMLLPWMTYAYNAQIDGIYYNLNSEAKSATVTCLYYESPNNRNAYSGDIIIPNEVAYNDVYYRVTSIGEYAFFGCSDLTSITIPESITYIGRHAFDRCSGLTSIIIPMGVVIIDDYAFYSCQSLTSITIHNSVASIGSAAFYGCNTLKSISIPNSVTSIGSDAFYGCNGLTSVTIYCPNVGSWFRAIISIKEITLGEGVTSIGQNAFSGCSGLAFITIPNSITRIGRDAFSGTSWFKNQPDGLVYLNSIVYQYKGTMSENTAITIKDGTKFISDGAFMYCSGLTSIMIPNSVMSIGNEAFYGCYKLNTIYCLNTTPPTCSSVNTFVCSTGSDAVRNVYDVYNYATLHVPMGSGEVYSSAYEWRYFNKIKEDMEANGNVYYANLTVKQGETGYIRQAIKAAESYKIFIGSLGGNKVNAVSFNGVDVTSEVANGYYTTPLITGESILSISYEISPSAVKDASLKNVKVIGNNGEITISNIDEPSSVSILTIDGKLVGTILSALGSVSMAVPIEQVYVVRVGTRSYKIAL